MQAGGISTFSSQMARVYFLLLLIISPIFSAACYTSVFSFGDSLIDTGNYLHIDNSSPTGHLPYGQTFFHRGTGRSCDGRVVVDFIAEALGIPFLPPYLAFSDAQQLRHGANFAVGGATALPARFFKERKIDGVTPNVSFGDQIEWFLGFLPSLCATPSACCRVLRGSLFLVGEIGGNDYAVPFASGWKLEEIRTIVPQVVGIVTSAVDTLIKHGATTLVVPGVLPLGCFAAILTMGESSNKEDYEATTGCLKNWNEMVKYHNRLLKMELSRLREMHPHATILYSDYYYAAWQAFASPQRFGFKEGDLSACCGGGGHYNYNASAPCGSPTAQVCRDPSLHWNWDGGHPTEGGQRLIADAVISKIHPFPPSNWPRLSFAPGLKYYPRFPHF